LPFALRAAMTWLIAGLIVFIGIHSTRIVADDWRTRMVSQLGEKPWKAIYSVIAIVGFILIVWGYGVARESPVVLYTPPLWTRHLAALLTIPAFILLVAAYVPGNRIKSAIGHPMVAGVKIWAFAHLISNGTVADVVLFGSLMLWAVASFTAARRRDRAVGCSYASGPLSRTAITVVVGLAAWAAFAFWLHGPLIGVRPFS
jgi:uncharacterized membrane protein